MFKYTITKHINKLFATIYLHNINSNKPHIYKQPIVNIFYLHLFICVGWYHINRWANYIAHFKYWTVINTSGKNYILILERSTSNRLLLGLTDYRTRFLVDYLLLSEWNSKHLSFHIVEVFWLRMEITAFFSRHILSLH